MKDKILAALALLGLLALLIICLVAIRLSFQPDASAFGACFLFVAGVVGAVVLLGGVQLYIISEARYHLLLSIDKKIDIARASIVENATDQTDIVLDSLDEVSRAALTSMQAQLAELQPRSRLQRLLQWK